MVAIVKHSIAVVGSRDYEDYFTFHDAMMILLAGKYCSELVSGGARGVDSMAERFARELDIPIYVIRPDYENYGKSAPIRRNTDIIKRADEVIAFWDGVSKGTHDAILKAVQSGKMVTIYSTKRSNRG